MAPLSIDTRTVSVKPTALLRVPETVPVTVWLGSLVIRSEPEEPLSAEKATDSTDAGATVSTLRLRLDADALVPAPALPLTPKLPAATVIATKA